MKHGRQGEGGGRRQFDGKPYELVMQKLREAWSMGCPDCEACALADISASSLCDFLKRNPKVAEEKARLLENPFLVARKSILAGMEIDPDLALKYMERKKRREFATLSQVELGEQGVFRDLSDTELAQIAAGKRTPADFIGLDKKPQVE